jgi:crossover junction endodeoxyribonuclease RuvC
MQGYKETLMILGIDPGKTGALAWLDNDGKLVLLLDMPLVNNHLSLSELGKCLNQYTNSIPYIEIQRGSSQQGCVSAFTTGYDYGAILTWLLAHHYPPVRRLAPVDWKRFHRLAGSSKEASREKAQHLFPEAELHLKKHHGRAEALLIASVGWHREIRGEAL